MGRKYYENVGVRAGRVEVECTKICEAWEEVYGRNKQLQITSY
jgi:hypothetical protein